MSPADNSICNVPFRTFLTSPLEDIVAIADQFFNGMLSAQDINAIVAQFNARER